MARAAIVGLPEGDGPRPPTRLGRYLLFDAFARGGMASVHLGRFEASPGLSRVVAIKRLHLDADPDGRLAQRLREEARLLFRVRHPNVVPLLDLVVTGEDLCLVLEYVHGASFSTLLAASSDGALAPDPRLVSIVVSVAADVLRGLHAAHEARAPDGSPLGIVHRDVSPQNIVVGLDGISRILDFGVAKALGRDKLTKLTKTGTTLGKVVYMSPEQLKGLPLTAQADLYSAGVVLWEALTGQSFADALEKSAAPPAPSSINRAVPEALDRVVMRALSREPRARFATGEEMAAELEDACPRAPTVDVTRFVERFAGDDLERRAELVLRVERAAAPADDSASDRGAAVSLELATDRDLPLLPVLPELAAPTVEFPILRERFDETDGDVVHHGRTIAKRQKSSSLPMLAMIGAAAIFFAALALVFTQATPTKKVPAVPEAETPAAPSAPSPLATLAPPTPTAAPLLPPPLPADPGIEALEFVPAQPPKPLASAAERGARRVAPKSESRAQPRPSARPRVDACDPPFTIDRDGKKRYRPECLQ